MSGNIAINPALMTVAAGSFFVTSEGYIAGFALDDPALRNEICAGIVSPSATAPMWGGEAITESLPTAPTEPEASSGLADSVTSVLALATAETNITGFTVFNQSAAMYQSPQSPCPLAPPGGGINFVRLGSGLRVVVPCSSGVAAALAGGAVDQAVYWDYTNQVLLSAPGGTALPVLVVGIVTSGNAQVPSYSSGTGFATWNRAGYCAVIKI